MRYAIPCPALIAAVTFVASIGGAGAEPLRDLTMAHAHPAALTVPWVPNAGQWHADAAFRAQTSEGYVWVTRTGRIVHHLSGKALRDDGGSASAPRAIARIDPVARKSQRRAPGWVLSETIVTTHPVQPIVGLEADAGGVSYSNPAAAGRSLDVLPAYHELDLGARYPGIALRLKVAGNSVEKLFTVDPHCDVAAIKVRLDGATALRIAGDGALEAMTGAGPVRFSAPRAFQTTAGARREIAARYLLDARASQYGFALGEYDPSLPVTIDPLVQSTFFGGAGNESVTGIAIHPTNGEVYVIGQTDSAALPLTSGAEQASNAGAAGTFDAYVTRLDAALTHRLQTTFFGGSNDEYPAAIAIHPATFDVYIAGSTTSPTLPATAGAQQTDNAGPFDGFVTRLNAALTQRLRTTFVGDTGDDRINALAIHPGTGEIIVAGTSTSAVLPATAGAEQTFNAGGNGDGFVTRLDPALSQRLRTTFVGDTGLDAISAVAVHPLSGEIVVAGYTTSTTLPASANSPQPANGGGLNAFITRLDADLSHRRRTTFLGGSGGDLAFVMAIHPVSGDIYVAGWAQSPDFPGLGGSQQLNYAGAFDVFVTRHNAALTQRLQSTLIGGTGEDRPIALAIHPATGEVFVAGYSNSASFPATTGGLQASLDGGVDAFVTRLDRELTRRVQSTYLGGGAGEQINAMAIHPLNGDLYVAGATTSTTFPGTSGAEQTANASTGTAIADTFVSRLTRDLTLADTTPSAWAFAAQVNVPAATLRTSNAVQMSGLSGLATIYVDGQPGSEFCVSSTGGCPCNVLPFGSALSSVADAQYVCVRHVSSAAPSDVTRTTLHVGGEAANFFVTTGTAFTPPCTLDVDGDGVQSALTDGLIIMRALFGLTGSAVTNGALGATPARPTWAQIQPYLNGNCGSSFAP